MIVSVTRLRLLSWRFLPDFVRATWAGARQARRVPGLVGERLAAQGGRTFWCLSAWDDEAALGASLARWRHDGPAVPDLREARERLAGGGRLSNVRHPSPAHRAGRLDPTPVPSRAGPRLLPRPGHGQG